MSIAENAHTRMERVLRAAFSPSRLAVHNDSARHAGHAGAGEASHFRVIIEAGAFAGKSRLERHRMVYAALSGEFDGGLHALQVKATAPGE